MNSSNPNYLPKSPSPNVITWGVRLQHINLRGGRNKSVHSKQYCRNIKANGAVLYWGRGCHVLCTGSEGVGGKSGRTFEYFEYLISDSTRDWCYLCQHWLSRAVGHTPQALHSSKSFPILSSHDLKGKSYGYKSSHLPNTAVYPAVF